MGINMLQIAWAQYLVFAVGLVLSALIIVAYRRRYIPREYHTAFSVTLVVAYPYILITSWLLNLQLKGLFEFNIVVSCIDLFIMITLFSIISGRLGVYLSKKWKNK